MDNKKMDGKKVTFRTKYSNVVHTKKKNCVPVYRVTERLEPPAGCFLVIVCFK